MSVANEIKLIRQKVLLSQRDFAERLSVTFATVNRWETGKTTPKMAAMRKIIVFLLTVSVLCTSVSAEIRVPDIFGNAYVEFDINADGAFDIRDLVRLKKYSAGIPVTVNLNFANGASGSAELLVSMRKELLKV